MSMNGIAMSFADRELFSDVTFDVYDDDRIGLVGVNGCGKTTLFRLLKGEHTPDEGGIHTAGSCKMGFMEQFSCKNSQRTVFDEALTVFDYLEDMGLELEELHDKIDAGNHSEEIIERQTLLTERFEREGGLTYKSRTASALNGLGFTDSDFRLSVGVLSGGQKSKLQLAKLLLSNANLLLLDEPTNHLDITSCEALENALMNYDGTMFIISHDRYLINKLADRIYYLTPDGVKEYLGSYDAYTLTVQNAVEQQAVQKPEKSPKTNDYKLKKERESERRKLNTRITRAEAEIDRLDTLIAEKTDELSGMTDYKEAMELSGEIEQLRTKQEEVMAEWEQASLALEEFDQ